jgi:hypothetical protein
MRRSEVVVAVNFGDTAASAAVGDGLALRFGTPSRPVLAAGMLDLPPHAGALLTPVGGAGQPV